MGKAKEIVRTEMKLDNGIIQVPRCETHECDCVEERRSADFVYFKCPNNVNCPVRHKILRPRVRKVLDQQTANKLAHEARATKK